MHFKVSRSVDFRCAVCMLNTSSCDTGGQQRQLNAVDGQVTPDSAVPNFPCCSKIVLEDTVTVKKASQLSVETFDPRCLTYPLY